MIRGAALGALFALGLTPGSRRVEVAPGEELAVTIAGVGPPVMLLPGLFGGAYSFRQLVPQLVEQGLQTITVEPLGIGASSRPRDADYSLTAQADRIATVLDSLGGRPVVIVAHSLGASIAFRMAYRRPDLVAGIVSLEGGPTEAIGTSSFRRAMRFAPVLRLVGGADLIRHEVAHELEAASGDPDWISEEVIRGYTASAAEDLSGTLRAYQGMSRAHEPESLAPHLGEVRVPVHLMIGTAKHDGGVDRKELELLERALPSFTVDTVVGAGHYLQEEQPSAVAAAVRRLSTQLCVDAAKQHWVRSSCG